MPLSDTACRGAKPDPSGKARKLTDGGGLYLHVAPRGGKLWRMRYRFEGKEKVLSFGPYPAITLADARGLRDRAKRALALGRDPGADNQAALKAPEGDTLETVALEWLEAQEDVWSRGHMLRIRSRFEQDIFPAIGGKGVADLTAADALAMLRKVEGRAPEIAKRLRQALSAVMRYAVATGRSDRDPVADLRGALKPSPRVKHMAALQATDLPTFMGTLRRYHEDGGELQTALAIELVMHTLTRTNEIRFGKWNEIEEDMWRIPADRMKMGREHLVPLTNQSLALLKRLKTIAGASEWIVPGIKGKPISQNTMIFALYRMGYRSKATIHGMRSLASTVLNESELWSGDAIERQLAHLPANAVRAAYDRGLRLDERRRMLTWWSEYLDKAAATVEARPTAAKPDPDSDLRRLLG